MIDHVLNNITTCQVGFLPGRSTTQQLLLCLNNIYKATSQDHLIYFDFCKAFDSLPHNKLLAKLTNHGITGTLWNWFNNYLSNCSQFVKICNSISSSVTWCTTGQHSWPIAFLNLHKRPIINSPIF